MMNQAQRIAGDEDRRAFLADVKVNREIRAHIPK